MGMYLLKNQVNKVFLIGGAPGAGKTTLGMALARKLGIKSLTIDDLVTAALTITTAQTHPGLHAMRKLPHVEYFTNSSIEQLKTDATLRHEATWPMVERLIQKYTSSGMGIVIDGWHLRPKWVAKLDLANVRSAWIVIAPTVLEERERQNATFWDESPRPAQMLNNFLARSLWYNDFIQTEATQQKMDILYQDGQMSADKLCQIILEKSEI